MKKLMIMVSAIMMVATADAKKMETESFSEVRVNVPARVRVLSGDKYSVNINGKEESSIRVTLKDGVLTLNSRDMESFDAENSRTVITITAPEDTKVTTGRDVKTLSNNVNKD